VHAESGESFGDECASASTIEEALQAAENLHAAIVLKTDGQGFGGRA
jgi:hypothetical protein